MQAAQLQVVEQCPNRWAAAQLLQVVLMAMRASNMQVNLSRAWFKYLILLPLLLKGTPGVRSGGGQLGFEPLQLLCVLYLAVSGRRAAFNRRGKRSSLVNHA